MATAKQVRERPILFSGPMVRAILDGRKTQTRRVADIPSHWSIPPARIVDGGFHRYGQKVDERCECPYGKPGDRLWVRETWATWTDEAGDDGLLFCYRADESAFHSHLHEEFVSRNIRAGEELLRADFNPLEHEGEEYAVAWKPSIHMRREYSRITLEITNVRAQRLQDISAKDIIAEGAVERAHHDKYLGKMPVSAFDGCCYVDLLSLWAAGWDKINGKKHPWASSPWVWAITFKRVLNHGNGK